MCIYTCTHIYTRLQFGKSVSYAAVGSGNGLKGLEGKYSFAGSDAIITSDMAVRASIVCVYHMHGQDVCEKVDC